MSPVAVGYLPYTMLRQTNDQECEDWLQVQCAIPIVRSKAQDSFIYG